MSVTSKTITCRIVQTVAAHSDSAPSELPPLYDTIDPDAVTAAINHLGDGTIEFTYAGKLLSIDSDGTIELTGGREGRVSENEPVPTK